MIFRKTFFLYFLCIFWQFFLISPIKAENKTNFNTLQLNELKEIKNERIEDLRKKYLTSHYEWLYKILDDAEIYRILVRNEIEKRNLPEILEYLPVVESNYIPTAKSSSGALGLWQFMLNSVKPFLEVNEYIDERLDVWKSTDAALSKLTDNYKMFNDWLLAITAYNCGAGALKRAIKKSGSNDFWYLADNGFLSEQACSYVPKLIAIADICQNASDYGKKFPTARDENGKTIDLKVDSDGYDYVTIKKQIHLFALASEIRLDENELLKLNLALIKEVTPPHKEYKIRLPKGMKEIAEYSIKKMK